MKAAFLFLLLQLTLPLGLMADPGDTGSLYVLVDHSAQLFINGANVKILKSKAAPKPIPITLNPGDRLEARLSSTSSHGDGYFMLLYISPDRQSMISFRAVSFKILPEPSPTDFTVPQFETNHRQAISRFDSKDKQSLFPYKNVCEGFWGDRAECAVGTIVTRDMFSPTLPQ